MTIYLNDLSLAVDGSILDNWEKVLAFVKLFDKLTGMNSLQVIAPKDLWNMPIAGYNVCSKTPTIPHDKYLTLIGLFQKFKLQTNGFPQFSETNTMDVVSSSMGKAAEEDKTVISFSFDRKYESEVLEGWLQTVPEGEVSAVSVNNICKDEKRIYSLIADTSLCKTKNPLEEPFWNVELMTPIMEKVNLIGQNVKDRESLLIHYGKLIAEMNGWQYNRKVSNLNSSDKKLRYIFDSRINFTAYPVAYISLDMEGPDLAFELHNKKGKHQGEYSWKGTHKDPKEKHDIRVK